jgi:L,D-peptidoglycan transpeptidase YkuD (ErfK/YbiS/YcfS/YnhG family)
MMMRCSSPRSPACWLSALAQTRTFCELLRFIVALVLIAPFLQASAADAEKLPRNCHQCLVVTTESWSSSKGKLVLFERDDNAAWHQHRAPIPVLLGRSGLAWGRGLFQTPSTIGPIKKEGDNKAPAGIFRLRCVFGYAREASIKMPYIALSENIVAVDDPRSRYYNQLIDKSKIKTPNWRSAEKMILPDDRYKWGVFVEHNFPPEPGAGSCIFLHVWKDPATLTSGCTAMAETDLVKVIQWLDPARHPLLVQLPQPLYNEFGARWDLPALSWRARRPIGPLKFAIPDSLRPEQAACPSHVGLAGDDPPAKVISA